MSGEWGCYNAGGLEGVREKYPKVLDPKGDYAEIPFSSDIKFNLMIRDMNPKIPSPTKAEDNMAIFMKGAPERILGRCKKILIKGKELDFSEYH